MGPSCDFAWSPRVRDRACEPEYEYRSDETHGVHEEIQREPAEHRADHRPRPHRSSLPRDTDTEDDQDQARENTEHTVLCDHARELRMRIHPVTDLRTKRRCDSRTDAERGIVRKDSQIDLGDHVSAARALARVSLTELALREGLQARQHDVVANRKDERADEDESHARSWLAD